MQILLWSNFSTNIFIKSTPDFRRPENVLWLAHSAHVMYMMTGMLVKVKEKTCYFSKPAFSQLVFFARLVHG